jgi:hypothetical protein
MKLTSPRAIIRLQSEEAFDTAARKQADNWLTWDNEIFGTYEGSQENFNYVVQPSPWGID